MGGGFDGPEVFEGGGFLVGTEGTVEDDGVEGGEVEVFGPCAGCGEASACVGGGALIGRGRAHDGEGCVGLHGIVVEDDELCLVCAFGLWSVCDGQGCAFAFGERCAGAF